MSEHGVLIVEELVQEEKFRQIAVLLYLLHTGHAIENDLRRAMTGGRYPVATHVARAVLSDLLDAKLVEMIRGAPRAGLSPIS
jgi:hypothetical protein